MSHILHTSTVHKTASLADEAYTTLNIYKWKLALRGHLLNTDAQARDRTRN